MEDALPDSPLWGGPCCVLLAEMETFPVPTSHQRVPSRHAAVQDRLIEEGPALDAPGETWGGQGQHTGKEQERSARGSWGRKGRDESPAERPAAGVTRLRGTRRAAFLTRILQPDASLSPGFPAGPKVPRKCGEENQAVTRESFADQKDQSVQAQTSTETLQSIFCPSSSLNSWMVFLQTSHYTLENPKKKNKS